MQRNIAFAVPATRIRNDNAALREVGVALYGNGWEAHVARDLGVDGRVVRRWLNGTAMIPEAIWPKLRKKLQLRRLELDVLMERLG